MGMFKVFLIEDDETIARLIANRLAQIGYDVCAAKDFADIMPEFLAFSPDLVLLDIILPRFDGFYWCGRIRTVSQAPVLFISSKDSEMDIIIATNMGGDDYLVKPFSLHLLEAKIAGLLRRAYSYGVNDAQVISHKGLVFHIDGGRAQTPDGTAELTRNEAQILLMLLRSRGSIVSREKLMRALWKESRFVDDNTLTVNITRIRKKLADIGLSDYIETRKNEGYII